MPRLCLPKAQRDKLGKALKEGDVTIAKLYDMTSEQRNTIFAHYVDKDFAGLVNARFEQAMLSNQKKAFANWIQRTLSSCSAISFIISHDRSLLPSFTKIISNE